LPRICSLAYFQPVIAELHEQPLPEGYLDYLRLKFQQAANPCRMMLKKRRFLMVDNTVRALQLANRRR
jgi:hypothetical protein